MSAPDPGWGPAVLPGLTALFRRKQVMKIRPAIVAARAMLFPGLLNMVVIGVALSAFERSLATRGSGPLVLVAGAGLVALVGVIWSRRAANPQPPPWEAAEDVFVMRVTLMSAFANVPLAIGFLGFFLGGGVWPYLLGAVATLALLFGLARPTQAMAAEMGPKMEPPITGEELWRRLLSE